MSTNRIDFRAQYLEDSRAHMLTELTARYIFSHFQIAEEQSIIDVGCGTGYFTRQLAKHLNNNCTVLGVDVDMALIDAAKELAEKELVNVQYMVGDARQLSQIVQPRYDVAMCHFLLSRVPTSQAGNIIDEMIKVVRPNGRLAILEPCLGAMVSMYSENQELSQKLTQTRSVKSYVQGQLSGIDENIGMKLPELLLEKGLKNISTEIVALRWWTPLPFEIVGMSNELREWYKRRLESLEKSQEQSTVEKYGKHDDAAAGLRFSSSNVPNVDDEVSRAFEQMGISKDDLVGLGNQRIKHLKDIIEGNLKSRVVSDFEIIPTFAVTGIIEQVI